MTIDVDVRPTSKHMARRATIPWVLVVLGLAGCDSFMGSTDGSGDGPDGSQPVSPEEACDIQAVFSEYECTSCHDATPGITGGGLDLLSTGLVDRVLNQPSVNPSCSDDLLVNGGRPEASLLLRVIAPHTYAVHGSPSCTAPTMPLGSDLAVSAEHVSCVDRWVQSVAAIDPIDEPAPFDPAPLEAALAKVKYLAHGGAVTDDELALVRDSESGMDREALRTLVDRWMWREPGVLTPEFDTKLWLFLELALQQRSPGGSSTFQFQSQLNLRQKLDGPYLDKDTFARSVPRLFVDTARDIVAEEQDFRQVVTTRRWRVTTAILAALVYADTWLFDDRGRLPHENRFIQFHHLTESDYSDWRYVTFEQATQAAPPGLAYENSASFANAVRAIGDGGTLRLWAPRIGFFSTFTFLDQWESNIDNQFRITVSQVLATALDLIFETGDPTEPANLAGLDAAHAEEGSACLSCHQTLDPMRMIFERYYTYGGRSRGALTGEPATFAFHGHVVPEISTMDEFAEAVVTHPRFAAAWTQKVCMWANSQRCLESDPEFQRVAERFRTGYDEASPNDDFRLTTLFREMLASPLITGDTHGPNHERNEFIVSATRYQHFCAAANVRLAEASARNCEANGIAPVDCDPPTENCFGNWKVGEAIGGDEYSRGARELTTVSEADPVYLVAVREACREYARGATQNDAAFPGRSETEPTIARMVETVMGLPPSHPRHDVATDTLVRTHQILRAGGACPGGQDFMTANEGISTGGDFVCGGSLNANQAMQQVFVIACMSPDLMGLGL